MEFEVFIKPEIQLAPKESIHLYVSVPAFLVQHITTSGDRFGSQLVKFG